MYGALLERDPSYEGIFVVGVRTTGVYCRPTCPARKPLRENVEYFKDARTAEAAGYRACRRCRPLEPAGAHPAWVARLLAQIEGQAAERVTDKALTAMALEPARVRRYFLGRFGMTFQAYQRSRRLGLALDGIAGGGDLLRVGFDAGFDSDSGFREAFGRLFGRSPGRARELRTIVATLLSTPIGVFVAAATPEGVCLFEFVDRPALLGQAAALRRWFDEPIVPGSNAHLERLREELAQYFGGTRQRFEVPLAIAGTSFQRAVWDRLLAIPYGETRSYEEIAIELGRPGAQRAVGRANGENRIAIIIPCHRVIRSDGHLGGYGGGLWRKRFLLERERALMRRPAAPDETAVSDATPLAREGPEA
jgi:AraC family transcriptional regulator of adaptative response/methylated-DNA-[protein]-cysteine methyltransferase